VSAKTVMKSTFVHEETILNTVLLLKYDKLCDKKKCCINSYDGNECLWVLIERHDK